MSASNSVHPTRRSAARRRGSVLLMVVAVLALMAIIAVAYTTLGRADRAASASLVRESRLDDQSGFIRDYLAQVIADDVLDVYAEQRGDLSWTVRREAMDSPGASDWIVSDEVLAATTGAARFRPTGGYFGPWTGGRTDQRRASDPWLASTEPEIMLQYGASLPPDSFDISQFDEPLSWRSISNFAPDGRPVNLANLRGNFNAEPGYSNAAPWRMSSRLNIVDDNDNVTNTNAITNQQVEQFNGIPADYTTNQFRAFRPMVDERRPEEAEHINNQWADADGDGFADSRWFELVDGFYANAPRWLLPQTGRSRTFIAARAIDACSMLNVNVHGDFLYEPQGRTNTSGDLVHFPAGLTPADVDLRRFLGMGDITWVYRDGSGYFGYNEFEQGPGVADYSEYHDPPANPISLAAGATAYAAIRHAINTGEVLPSDARRGNPSNDPSLQLNAGELTPNPNNPNPLTDAQRARLYDEFGFDPSSARSLSVGGPFRARAPFGVADELELRTFNGVNDSDHLSPLERVTGGREDRRFGPMRENRPRSVEMKGRPDSATGDASQNALLSVFADIRHLLTTDTGARAIIDNPAVAVNPSVLSGQEFRTDALALLSRLDKSTGMNPTAADIDALFEVYASALMPYTNENFYPDAWDRSVDASYGLSYGESAELAQRICAHMTANLIDAIDDDRNPLAGTSIYDRNFQTVVALEAVANAPTDPEFEPTNVLALDNALRPDVGETMLYSGAPRLNVYGIEVQPFITEVGWFGVFTDTPRNALVAGDNDFQDNQTPPIPPETEPTLGPVTIDDEIDPSNPDFLFEVLAFQITNPFDRPLMISEGGQASYYVEYANRFFGLIQRNEDGTGVDRTDIIIPPYGTRVFYVTNVRNPADAVTRMQNAMYPTTAAPIIPPQYVKQWAQNQFGMDSIPMPMVHQSSLLGCPAPVFPFGAASIAMYDIFGERQVAAGAAGEPVQSAIGPSDPETSESQRAVAYLWRRPNVNQSNADDDILLDRIRDDPTAPAGGTIWQKRTSGTGNTDITHTEAGNDTDGVAANDEDNTGFSITKWAAFRRATNPSTGYKRGSMPAWTLEVKDPSPQISEYTTALNDSQTGPANGLGSGIDYRGGSQVERRSTLNQLRIDQAGQFGIVNTGLHADVELKTGNAITTNRSMPAKNFDDVAVQIQLSGGRNNPQLFARAGDFLLPLAIGPSFNPLAPVNAPLDPSKRVDQLEAQWMTLSEALALSSDYYTPTFAADPVLYRFGHSEAGATPIRPRADRGNLVLNDFAPYLDLNDDRVFDLDDDVSIGRGVPLALGVVDLFNTTDRWKQDAAGNLSRRTRAHGGTRIRINGLININTAPPSVLRMVPMFAPDVDGLSWTRTGAMAADRLYNPMADIFDIATTVVAYRDKSALNPRPRAAVGSFAANDQLNFRDDNDGDDTSLDGRFRATRIAAIREQPGFKSLGEVMALRYNDPTVNGPSRIYENSIDRFTDTSGTPTTQPKRGLESTLWKDPNSTAFDVDQMVNDYDEQLAIANAAMNSLTVRSDVFCVWFLIHGYLPSDVENLGPLDPMIPSIARRYVMVVDRSNVVELGQKPKILLLQEVPIQ